MLHGIQRLWKRWAVLYQEPAVLNETIFLPSCMVMRPRCLVVSWKHRLMYRCWIHATVTCVREGSLRLLIEWSRQCCLGGIIPGAFPPSCCLFLGKLCSWLVLYFFCEEWVSQGECWTAVLCSPCSSGKFMTAWSGQHRESFAYQWVLPSAKSHFLITGLWWITN